MLLVSTNTIRATNQMSEKNAGSYLHFSINTQTYLLRKTSKDRLPLPVVNLDKSSVCGDRKTSFSFWQSEKLEFIYIGSFGLSGVTRIWGPNIGRSRRYRVWSHDETVKEEKMKNKRLEIVTCRLAGGGGGGARARVPIHPPHPPLDPGLHSFIYTIGIKLGIYIQHTNQGLYCINSIVILF